MTAPVALSIAAIVFSSVSRGLYDDDVMYTVAPASHSAMSAGVSEISVVPALAVAVSSDQDLPTSLPLSSRPPNDAVGIE